MDCGYSFRAPCPARITLASSSVGRTIQTFTLSDHLGTKHSLDDWENSKAIVIVFLGTECPLANLYATRLVELTRRYNPKRVQIVGINANGQDTLLEIGHYARIHNVDFPLLKDGLARLVPAGSKLGFQVHYTPNGSEQFDQSEVGLIFADPKEVVKESQIQAAINLNFTIPPGASDAENPDRTGPFNNTVVRVREKRDARHSDQLDKP